MLIKEPIIQTKITYLSTIKNTKILQVKPKKGGKPISIKTPNEPHNKRPFLFKQFLPVDPQLQNTIETLKQQTNQQIMNTQKDFIKAKIIQAE